MTNKQRLYLLTGVVTVIVSTLFVFMLASSEIIDASIISLLICGVLGCGILYFPIFQALRSLVLYYGFGHKKHPRIYVTESLSANGEVIYGVYEEMNIFVKPKRWCSTSNKEFADSMLKSLLNNARENIVSNKADKKKREKITTEYTHKNGYEENN